MTCFQPLSFARSVALTLLVALSQQLHAEDVLDVRIGNFYPNYYQTADQQWAGIDIEMTEALLERADFKPNFIEVPWTRALVMAEKGQVDMLVNVNITDDRSRYLHWIGPQRYTQMNLIVKNGNTSLPINSLDDLVRQCEILGLKFGYQPGVAYGDEFAERLRTDSSFKACADPLIGPQNDDKVLLNRLLGYFSEPLDVLAEKHRDPDYGLAVHSFTVIKEPVFFAFSRAAVSADQLLRLLQAYESLVEDGSLKAIAQRWMFSNVGD